jgi:hypothetical protein
MLIPDLKPVGRSGITESRLAGSWSRICQPGGRIGCNSTAAIPNSHAAAPAGSDRAGAGMTTTPCRLAQLPVTRERRVQEPHQ